jgi:tellurium resistance protein TerD
MTCFFDPSHGPGQTPVLWQPQWGVPRQIQACPACAQRVQTTPPPYYTAPQAQGYPQPGYGYPPPYADGYPEPPHHGHRGHHGHREYEGYDEYDERGGRRFGVGAVAAAGAAGLIGGALLNEAFDDDQPDVVINEFDGDGDGDGDGGFF